MRRGFKCSSEIIRNFFPDDSAVPIIIWGFTFKINARYISDMHPRERCSANRFVIPVEEVFAEKMNDSSNDKE